MNASETFIPNLLGIAALENAIDARLPVRRISDETDRFGMAS
ncbi:hypothetical protein [Pendulispora rubella]